MSFRLKKYKKIIYLIIKFRIYYCKLIVNIIKKVLDKFFFENKKYILLGGRR